MQNADLGLPDLPAARRPAAAPSFTSLVSGTHTLRVWYAGEDQQRLALLGTLGESDMIRNGTDVWTWSSDDNAADPLHRCPARTADAAAGDTARDCAMPTPQEAADAAPWPRSTRPPR